ncbi:hypothetical protein J2Z34_001347 [Youngiibacter multivorans]|uniref:Uncharacterized protein n=1 Tax=Youngiibacter multivorans TaxID=937251 RepID=A0ABS4G2V5_9CLOT|nr:hypothetical protein [Youngiibacter multivorans]
MKCQKGFTFFCNFQVFAVHDPLLPASCLSKD